MINPMQISITKAHENSWAQRGLNKWSQNLRLLLNQLSNKILIEGTQHPTLKKDLELTAKQSCQKLT